MLTHRAGTEAPFRVALVNNMPDSAFVDTEEQFRRAVSAVADPPRLDLHTITEIPRSDAVMAVIEERYDGLEALWADPPDALIITGTEPAQAQLPYEPYWPYLARLLEWAADAVPTAILSCLAAHASILLFDGIDRAPRATKLTGVYRGRVSDPQHPLARGLAESVPVPHSRLNDVDETRLREAGYEIVVGEGEDRVGWSIAARRSRRCLFVLCQGHPEYSAVSLLREYRRDVRRSVFGRGGVSYPPIPHGYLGPESTARLQAFAARAARGGEEPRELFAEFPYDEVASTLKRTWADASTAFYANWLELARLAPRVV